MAKAEKPKKPEKPKRRTIKEALIADGYPRLQMMLLVGLTGCAGFLTSYTLLHSGLHTIWVRYLLAMVVAYGAFLLLLWLWLKWPKTSWSDLLDPTDLIPSRGGGGGGISLPTGGGGNFGGAGASAAFEAPAQAMSAPLLDPGNLIEPSSGGSDLVGDAVGAVADSDEFAIPLMVIVLVLTLLLSSLWVIWSAPSLFAELLVDSALSAGLYHKLRQIPRRHWLETAIRRTIWPFLITTVVVVATGWGMNHLVPEAKSIGEFLAAGQATP